MNRHIFQSFLIVALLSNTSVGDKPNILWLITEDMGPEVGCYGTKEVSTPVLDDLAARGMRFTSAFTVTPVCSTSRSSFCTGNYALTIGAHQHRTRDKQPLPDGVRPITEWLHDVGYYTCNMRGGSLDKPGKTDWNFTFDGKGFQGSKWSDLKGNQPFYAQVNHGQTHRGWSAPKHADPTKVEIPPYYPDHSIVRDDWAKYLDEVTEVDGLIGKILQRLKDDGLADNTIIVMMGDHGRAHLRGKQWPYDSGLKIPLIIYFPPGVAKPSGFEAGKVSDQIVESIDITASTLDWAGVKKPPKMEGRVLFGDNAEPPRDYAFASRDRCDMTLFRIRTVRDKQYRYIRNGRPEWPFFALNFYKEFGYPGIGVMRELHKAGKLNPIQDRFFNMTRPAEELYDITADPWETVNLAESDKPEHKATIDRLREELDSWLEQTGDASRALEAREPGLAEVRGRIERSDREQLQYILQVLAQQRKSPDISKEYLSYLDQIEPMIREGMKSKAPPEKQPPKDAPQTEDKATSTELEPNWVGALTWRGIGPATMGGRVVDIAVVESDPTTFYVATASGGLFKTTNNGTTFTAVFEKQSSVSIGDVCVSHSDPKVVWVGTGEHNVRNSVSWGDGVYKSIDGGKSWKNMKLKKSFQIGRIAIHPTNPDVVYVGALGRLWGPNEERGVYKTTDGGATWEKILYVDDKTGCVDIAMHPQQADTLIVAMYERQRDEFDDHHPSKRWGPGSGLFKSTDGGATWKKLAEGLPDRPLGRVGIAYSRQNPNTVFTIVESDMYGTGPATAFIGITSGQRVPRALIQGIVEGGPADKAGLKKDDVVVAIDDKEIKTYNDLVVAIRAQKPNDKVKITFERGDEKQTVELTFGKRGGDASSRPFATYQSGQRPNAQKEQGKKGYQTGGVYKSIDGGESWTRVNSLNPRPYYYSQIRVDPTNEKNLYVLGIQLFQSTNGGEAFRNLAKNVHPDHHALWIDPRDGRHMILGCDGGLYKTYDRGQTWDFHNIMDIGQFYDVGVDTRANYRVYGGLQDNGSWGGPSRKRGRIGPLNSDWEMVGGGDGFVCRVDPNDPNLVYCEMQNGRIWRVNLETGARLTIYPQKSQASGVRFNWKAPFMLSSHNSTIFYCAGNFVFRSLESGRNLQKISPEISRTKRGSATAIAESPLDSNVLYAGTDDGALWITRDGGQNWTSIAEDVGLPGHFHVSSIEASRFQAGRAYLAFDGHRSNNDDPHVYVTEDFGKSWRSIRANLPIGSTRVLREDVKNGNLLYVGTEFGIWATINRGETWTNINNNLPTVAIHEIAVHPTQGEIVVATHGRSLWILDVAPLQQLDAKIAAAKSHLFEPHNGVLWAGTLLSWRFGHQNFVGKNAEFGSRLHYFLTEDVKRAGIEIRDIRGNLVRQLKADKKAGLHSTRWDLRQALPQQKGRPRIGPPVKPGVYLAKLIVDDQEFVQELKVEADPDFPAAALLEELEFQQRKDRPTFVE